ncbi:hypothetical protein SOPP22_07000 [Shewanella sp. OPT22]|nr:hypothetical protein SOPP22_07000 [Shewanella sp. OPT22]
MSALIDLVRPRTVKDYHQAFLNNTACTESPDSNNLPESDRLKQADNIFRRIWNAIFPGNALKVKLSLYAIMTSENDKEVCSNAMIKFNNARISSLPGYEGKPRIFEAKVGDGTQYVLSFGKKDNADETRILCKVKSETVKPVIQHDSGLTKVQVAEKLEEVFSFYDRSTMYFHLHQLSDPKMNERDHKNSLVWLRDNCLDPRIKFEARDYDSRKRAVYAPVKCQRQFWIIFPGNLAKCIGVNTYGEEDPEIKSEYANKSSMKDHFIGLAQGY